MDDLSDSELIQLARKSSDRGCRAELWDRADADIGYRGDGQLAATLASHSIRRPKAGVPAT